MFELWSTFFLGEGVMYLKPDSSYVMTTQENDIDTIRSTRMTCLLKIYMFKFVFNVSFYWVRGNVPRNQLIFYNDKLENFMDSWILLDQLE